MGSITHDSGNVQTPPPAKSIQARIISVLVDVCGIAESAISAEAELELALGADSLDLVSIEMALEEEFFGEWKAGESLQEKGLRLSMSVQDVTNHISAMLVTEAACARHS